MEYRRKPPSLLELCIRTTMDNLRYVQSVDGVEMNLLERILPHCKLEDLTRIEDNTEMDLSSITDKMWKLFYRQQFGEDSVNLVIKRMSTSGVRYKWRNLFEAKTEKQKEFADKMGQRLAKKYEAAKAETGWGVAYQLSNTYKWLRGFIVPSCFIVSVRQRYHLMTL